MKEIKDQLPPTLRLPFTKPNDFWLYYKNLPPNGIILENEIVIMLYIPVEEMYERFDIYSMTSLPLPINNAANSDSAMLVDYKLNSAGIAINLQRTRFALLDTAGLDSCSVH